MKNIIGIALLVVAAACSQKVDFSSRPSNKDSKEFAQWQREFCNYDSAFQRGEEEGKKSMPKNDSFVDDCPRNDQKIVEQGYREGYELGSKNASRYVAEDDLDKSQWKVTCRIRSGRARGMVENRSSETIKYDGLVRFELLDATGNFTRNAKLKIEGFVPWESKKTVAVLDARPTEADCKFFFEEAVVSESEN